MLSINDLNLWSALLAVLNQCPHLYFPNGWFKTQLIVYRFNFRQSAECESLIEASRLGILKINPDMYWLSNLCRHYVLMFIGSTEPHRYLLIIFVYSLLNIKLVFRYKNHFVSHCFSVFASKVVNFIHHFNHSLYSNRFSKFISH